MFSPPQTEHAWLKALIGQWVVESECIMGPDQSPQNPTGTLEVESLGGLWVTAVGLTPNPDGDSWKSILTLGYDPAKQQYVGTFIASMMPNLWTYAGQIDETGKKLILDTEGPKFDSNELTRYQDVIELVDENHWILWSQVLTDDGSWMRFMTSHHQRVGV